MKLPKILNKFKRNKTPKRYYSLAEVHKIIAEVQKVAYNDGKRAGIAIARRAATNSLKEILWQQNKTTKK